MMIVSIGAYHHRIGWARSLRILALCFAGNLIGGLVGGGRCCAARP